MKQKKAHQEKDAYKKKEVKGSSDPVTADKNKKETNVLCEEKESVKIPSDQVPLLHSLLWDFEKLFHLARLAGKHVSTEIVGHTDSIGTETINMLISKKRAQAVRAFLSALSLETGGFISVLAQPHVCKSCHSSRLKNLFQDMFRTVAIADKEPLREEVTDKDREANRCVTFRVTITESLSKKD